MYAFPNIKLPEKFIKEAGQKGLVPDAYYCTLLLEQTGICVVAGSGFRQKVNQLIIGDKKQTGNRSTCSNPQSGSLTVSSLSIGHCFVLGNLSQDRKKLQ